MNAKTFHTRRSEAILSAKRIVRATYSCETKKEREKQRTLLDDTLDAIDALPRMRHCIRTRCYCPRDIMVVMLYDPWIHFVPSFAL